MSFEDCVVIRICCKRKKNSVRLINILVVYIITSVYLPLKCDDGRSFQSQVDEPKFLKNKYIFHIWGNRDRWPNSSPATSFTGAVNESKISELSIMKANPASGYSPVKVFHVSTFISTAVFYFLQERYERLRGSKDKYILLML